MIYSINPYSTSIAGISVSSSLDYMRNITLDTETLFVASAIIGSSAAISVDIESSFLSTASQEILGGVVVLVSSTFISENTEILGTVTVDLYSSTELTLVENINASLVIDIAFELESRGYVTFVSEVIGQLASEKSNIVSMNTKSTGVSTYSKYNFNSFIKVGSSYYGCADSGLYELGGDLDVSSNVATAIVKTGASDYGTQALKSIRDIYAYIRSGGDVSVSLLNNEQTERGGYILYYDNIDGIHRRRVKVAQGLRGTSWQLTIKNEEGSPFTIKQVDTIPIELDRSI